MINAVANKMGVGCADEYECFNRFYKDAKKCLYFRHSRSVGA